MQKAASIGMMNPPKNTRFSMLAVVDEDRKPADNPNAMSNFEYSDGHRMTNANGKQLHSNSNTTKAPRRRSHPVCTAVRLHHKFPAK